MRLDFKLTNKVKPLLAMVNKFIMGLSTSNLSETNILVFAVAYVLTSKVATLNAENRSFNTPPWKARLQHKIRLLRKEISQLSAVEQHHSSSLSFKLLCKYHIQERGLPAAIEDAKQRLLALSHRLRRYVARCEQYRQNNLFRNCPGKLYDSFQRKPPNNDGVPDKSDVYQFWSSIWGASRSHNKSAQWLNDLFQGHNNLPEQAAVFISSDDVSFQIK